MRVDPQPARTASRLNVTQTAVSTRVRNLETQLGRKLFVRNKAGATLTPARTQFLRYAPAMVQLWQRARHGVAIPPGHRAALTIGAEPTLWDPLLLKWLLWMRKTLPDIAVRVHVATDDLSQRAARGAFDVAVTYAPRILPGLKVETVLDERLVMVSTKRGCSVADAG